MDEDKIEAIENQDITTGDNNSQPKDDTTAQQNNSADFCDEKVQNTDKIGTASKNSDNKNFTPTRRRASSPTKDKEQKGNGVGGKEPLQTNKQEEIKIRKTISYDGIKGKYFDLSEAELDVLCDKDDTQALVEKGMRALKNDDNETAERYFTFASVLGDADGLIQRARQLEKNDMIEEAYDHYMRAYSKGIDAILPHIVELVAISNPDLAQEILTATALEGNVYCIQTLIEKSKRENNQDEFYFWSRKLEEYMMLAEAL